MALQFGSPQQHLKDFRISSGPTLFTMDLAEAMASPFTVVLGTAMLWAPLTS